MKHDISRRDILKNAIAASGLIPVLALTSKNASADESAALNPDDPSAKVFGFVTDAAKVVRAAHPTFQDGQLCRTCSQYRGTESDPTAACIIFGGRSVPAGGWCKVWSKRAG